MDSTFNWCIRLSRIHFQIIHLDIFESPKRYSVGFMLMLMLFINLFCGVYYTICNYDTETAFNAVLSFTGLIQVRIHNMCTVSCQMMKFVGF